jgi:hypothetical protein
MKKNEISAVCLSRARAILNDMFYVLICIIAARWLGVFLFGSGFFLTRYSMRTTNLCANGDEFTHDAFRPPSNLVADNVCRHVEWLQ